MVKKRKIDQISCTCKKDRTPSRSQFKANATDCICQLNNFKTGKSVDLKVGAATIAIG